MNDKQKRKLQGCIVEAMCDQSVNKWRNIKIKYKVNLKFSSKMTDIKGDKKAF